MKNFIFGCVFFPDLRKDLLLTGMLIWMAFTCNAQEVWFFSEGTDQNFYDQGIVDVDNLGESTFEHTFPPGLPQYNDKVPCSTNAYKGSTSLRFNYTSASGGNWKVSIFRNGWTAADISGMDSLSFYAFSAIELPASALPKIGLRASNKTGSGEVSSLLYALSSFNSGLPAGIWTRITFPLENIKNDDNNSQLNFSAVKAVIFSQSETNNTARTILVDEITAYRSLEVIPPVTGLTATGYDSHAELSWTAPMENLTYRVYASFNGGASYEFRAETTGDLYHDFVPGEGKNSTLTYRVVSLAQGRESQPAEATASIRDFTDDELLDMLQQYTFRYFWEGAHQASGMALERTDGSSKTVASGGTGMGLMAMISACEREYRPPDEIKDRILMILSFLETCDRHHGAWSHWYDASTGNTQPFSTDDDGGDLVETSYVAQALIALKNYFTGNDAKSLQIREKADLLWQGIEWDWYRQNDQNVLYWHWSPRVGFKINMKVRGWNECLITYVMAASSPTYGIPKTVYTQGWAANGGMVNTRTYYGYEINLSPNWGGPLFWLHYSHLGLNPHGLQDQYADYWQEHVNTVKIHYEYAIANPKEWENYSDQCWGLTASDDPYGYTAHQPMSNDNGTISPTAALSSLPYAPDEVLKALKYFYRERGSEIFGIYGFYDAFNDHLSWVKKAYLAIDQGPIAVMLENYRTGLLWNSFMKDDDVRAGLDKLGFQYLTTSMANVETTPGEISIYPNPARNHTRIYLPAKGSSVSMRIYNAEGRLLMIREFTGSSSLLSVDCSDLMNGLYIIQLTAGDAAYQARLLIQR